LLELGHRRIGLVMGPQNTSTSRDRAEGALAQLEAAGIAREQVRLTWGQYNSESGYSSTVSLLTRGDAVTAIIAANDKGHEPTIARVNDRVPEAQPISRNEP